MILEIPEWGAVDGVELQPGEVQWFARSEHFSIRPDAAAPGRWRVASTQFVGVAHVGSIEVRVVPKVPVHRLLELLCTSIERIAWDPRDTLWAESDDLLVTVAGSFVEHAERVINAGLLQGYVSVEEDLYGVRGRIDLGRQISRHPGLPLPVSVTYDEYTIDILENQLLAGAGRILLRLGSLPVSLLQRLRRIGYRLQDVTPARPSARHPHVEWTRLNQRYRAAATLARLILSGSALEFDGDSSTTGVAFLVDMNRVFEDIVGESIRSALASTGLTTRLQSSDHLDAGRHLPIRPDVLISSIGTPIAVADVKYKRAAQSGVANDDVYQALAYAARYQLTECMLIYPEKPPFDRLEVGGITVRLESIDLRLDATGRMASVADLATSLTVHR